jgi:1-phosphofructokinase
MIITLTPTPSVDRTIEVDALVRGAVLRARSSRVDPGGKGVNVSRALAANGRKTRAVLPAGGWEGDQLAALLAPQDIPVVLVPVAGSIRANVNRERFAGKPIVQGPVKRAINDASGMLSEAEAAARTGSATAPAAASAAPPPAAKADQQPHLGLRLRGWLMTESAT